MTRKHIVFYGWVQALHTVDELADMIIYHANVRENARAMSETWEM
jgi:hypothetical protein